MIHSFVLAFVEVTAMPKAWHNAAQARPPAKMRFLVAGDVPIQLLMYPVHERLTQHHSVGCTAMGSSQRHASKVGFLQFLADFKCPYTDT